MINFGLGELVDRFERHFGVRLTKLILGIAAFVFCALAISAAFQLALVPLFAVLGSILLANETAAEIATGFNLVVGIVAIPALAFASFFLLRTYRWQKSAKRDIAELKRLRIDAREANDEMGYAVLRLKDAIMLLPNGADVVEELRQSSTWIDDVWRDREREK